MTWQLFMILVVYNANATYGGPVVVDGFKSQEACIAHAEKIKKMTPDTFPRNWSPNAKLSYEYVGCVRKDAS